MNKLVEIKGVTVNFYTYEGVVQALHNLDLDIYQGETLGLVGETGCGKTMAALSILRLIIPPGKIESGKIYYCTIGGQTIDLLTLTENEIREIRGSQISMVFQEPSAALNPVYTIGDQITESIMLHRKRELARNAQAKVDKLLAEDNNRLSMIIKPLRVLQRNIYSTIANDTFAFTPRLVGRIPIIRRLLWRIDDEALLIASSLLKEVEIADPSRVLKQHPHQLSGGMKQRVVIAMALACCTRLLIADEPTTSLDVTIQAQILELIKKLKSEIQTSILYITHDLAVAAEICDRVGVMYSGSICELAEVKEVYQNPLHPYTKALMAAVPKPGKELSAISGFVPDPLNLPPGCRFHPRCDAATKICSEKQPSLVEINPKHFVACHLFNGDKLGKSS
ncbi:MAG: ABC transporter ATP-binding protein [Dehalococcoidia bacterium]|nr:MAG: ABC transporter ATP-binding protein [Dehalococcoidia bacterium]